MCVYNDNYILQWILDLVNQNPKSTGFNKLEKMKPSKAMKLHGHSL